MITFISMDFYSSTRNKIWIGLLLASCMIALHFPFLKADPDIHISTSRGANTDEGLYTCQIRNFINVGELGMSDTDGLVKTPLLSAVLYPAFKIFGISKRTARTTLLVLFIAAFILGLHWNKFTIIWASIASIILLLEYYIFHFSHYCLAEILSSISIFLGLVFLWRSEKNQSNSLLIVAAFFCSLAYYFKIQYIYVLPILPIALVLQFLVTNKKNKAQGKRILIVSAALLFFLLLYLLCWYWPNKELLNFVLSGQTQNRWILLEQLPGRISYVLKKYFHNSYLFPFTVCFYLALILGMIRMFNKPSKLFKFLFIGLLSWMIVEMHKFCITYLPTRYVISFIFQMGMLTSLVITEYLLAKTNRLPFKMVQIFLSVALVFLGSIHIKDYISSHKNRSFEMEKIDAMMADLSFGRADRRKPIIGPWAPSLSWQSKNKAIPVWKHYFNDHDPINKLDPFIIVSELDEEDSNQAYSSQGIHLDSLASKSYFAKVNKWDLKLLLLD